MSYKLVDYVQGSLEWHKWRRLKIGASEIAPIMGDCPYETPLTLFEKKITGEEKKDNRAMQMGREAEPKALEWVNNKLGTNYKPVCVESTDHPHLILSLDGWDPHASIPILEIKRMGKDKHEAARQKIIPINYQWQVQDQMFVTGSDAVLFCSYQNDEDVVLLEEKENASMWNRIQDETRPFYERLLNFDAPPPCEKDYYNISDIEIINLLGEYDSLEKSFKEIENRIKEARNAIIAGIEKYNVKRAILGSRKISNYLVRGRIDYDEIPEIKTLKENGEIEKYRKSSSSQWKITKK